MMIKVFLSEEHNVHLHCNNETSSWGEINNTQTTIDYTIHTLHTTRKMMNIHCFMLRPTKV